MPLAEVALRAKGRLTLPARLRKALGLQEGDRLTAELREGAIVLRPRGVVRVRALRGLIGRHRVKLTDIETALGANVEEELKQIRG